MEIGPWGPASRIARVTSSRPQPLGMGFQLEAGTLPPSVIQKVAAWAKPVTAAPVARTVASTLCFRGDLRESRILLQGFSGLGDMKFRFRRSGGTCQTGPPPGLEPQLVPNLGTCYLDGIESH